jgi:hypothetical protein
MGKTQAVSSKYLILAAKSRILPERDFPYKADCDWNHLAQYLC